VIAAGCASCQEPVTALLLTSLLARLLPIFAWRYASKTFECPSQRDGGIVTDALSDGGKR